MRPDRRATRRSAGGRRARGVCGRRSGTGGSSGAQPAGRPARSGGWQDLVSDDRVDIVVVATTNDALADIAVAAIEAGKHVLVEKPAGRSVAEIDRIADAAKQRGRLVRVGFNHRYHPALPGRADNRRGRDDRTAHVRARALRPRRPRRLRPRVARRRDAIGRRRAHRSRRAPHRPLPWLLGPFARVDGAAHTYFWDMPVDDNAFLRLTTAAGQVAFLHVSCTEWKNLFSFEIYGRTGKLHIEGLGGSYGIERLAHYQMRPEMGPPDTTIYEYPQGDRSWDARVRRVPRRHPARPRTGRRARGGPRGAGGRRGGVRRVESDR